MSKSLTLKKKTKQPYTKAQKSIKSFFTNKSDGKLTISNLPTKPIPENTSECSNSRKDIDTRGVNIVNKDDVLKCDKIITTSDIKNRKRRLSPIPTNHTNCGGNEKKTNSLGICFSVSSPSKKRKQMTKSACQTPEIITLNGSSQVSLAELDFTKMEKQSEAKISPKELESIKTSKTNITPTKETKLKKSPCSPSSIVTLSSDRIKRNINNEMVNKSTLDLDEVNKENKKIEPSKELCEPTRPDSFSNILDDEWDDILLKSEDENSTHKNNGNKNIQKPLLLPNRFLDISVSTKYQNDNKTPEKSTTAGIVLRRSPRNHKSSQSPGLANQNFGKIEIHKLPKQSLQFDKVEVGKDLLSEENTKKHVDDFNNMFEDEWDNYFLEENVEEITLQNLNLQIWQRCEIVGLEKDPKTFNITIEVREIQEKSWAKCRLEGIWRDSALTVGDIVCLVCMKDDRETFVINNTGGLLVQWPDTLLSGTTIVGSIFCKRKAVLQERFKGIDCNNKIMTIGSLVHELLQIALRKELSTITEVTSAAQNLLQDLNCLYMLYGADMSNEEAMMEISKFLPQIVTFIDKYMNGGIKNKSINSSTSKYTESKKKSDEWVGEIQSILDIEENIWSPRLGVKGKIDVTVLVHSRNKESKVIPLELKTGKASMSSEHRGQVLLYTMMMSLKEQAKDPSASDVTQGLLLYLKDTVIVKEISSGYPEKRDLIMLRNQLAYYLARQPTVNRPEELATSRASSTAADSGIVADDISKTRQDLVPMELPDPINHHSACGNCPYLTMCSVYLERYSPGSISDSHPLSKLKKQAVGHLEQNHVEYFIHWTGLLVLEDMEKASHTPLRDIWLRKPEEREKRGKCLSSMVVSGKVVECDKRYIHTFVKKHINSGDIGLSTLQAGEYLVVSSDIDIAVATGTVSSIDKSEIRISLDRNLLKRNKKDMHYHLDLYESQSNMSFNLTNLGVLTDNTDHSDKLRRMIIDKNPPTFSEKMPRSVATLGKKILSRLNLVQQKAVLKALTADHYLLIKGMPGTGKTQTVAALIELLVAMDKSVLVTSHTHSAVDNVLLRLPDTVKVMRLGSSSRVQPGLLMVTEECLTAHCNTPDDLAEVYNSVKVVGVTCLGAGHPMLTKRKFDVCLVDESTQVLQSAVLRPLFAATKFVLIGDPDQLPPIVRSNTARRLGLDESLFARLDGLGGSVSLTLQYRMNAVITRLANRLTYAGQLQCANQDVKLACLQMPHYNKFETEYKKEKKWLLKCISPSFENSVILLDTGSTYEKCQTVMEKQNSKSLTQKEEESRDKNRRSDCTNVIETIFVLAIVNALLDAGVKSENIGVIAPYRDQVGQLQKCVGNLSGLRNTPAVEVNTVDQYQGRDKEVIIYSCTKTWNHQKGKFIVKDTEILEDQRRLTVAITRAKHKLIMIGDVSTLQHYTTFNKLLECLRHEQQEAFVSLQQSKCAIEDIIEQFQSCFDN